MPVVEELKRIVEKLTGFGRPQRRELARLARPRAPQLFRFRDDGETPNSRLPLVVYRGALQLDEAFDPAAVFEETFARHGWRESWRDGIYDYVHYHSRIHEALGIARGKGRVRFGGKKGRIFTLKAGDVAVLPAGTGHQCLSASEDFLVVGAYPPTGTYDVCTTVEDRPRALKLNPLGLPEGHLEPAWQGRPRGLPGRASPPDRLATYRTNSNRSGEADYRSMQSASWAWIHRPWGI